MSIRGTPLSWLRSAWQVPTCWHVCSVCTNPRFLDWTTAIQPLHASYKNNNNNNNSDITREPSCWALPTNYVAPLVASSTTGTNLSVISRPESFSYTINTFQELPSFNYKFLLASEVLNSSAPSYRRELSVICHQIWSLSYYSLLSIPSSLQK